MCRDLNDKKELARGRPGGRFSRQREISRFQELSTGHCGGRTESNGDGTEEEVTEGGRSQLFTDLEAGSHTSDSLIQAVKHLWDPRVCEFETMQGYT